MTAFMIAYRSRLVLRNVSASCKENAKYNSKTLRVAFLYVGSWQTQTSSDIGRCFWIAVRVAAGVGLGE